LALPILLNSNNPKNLLVKRRNAKQKNQMEI